MTVPQIKGAELPTRTALYRLYDANDQLLYVGISDNPRQRWGTHSAEQVWWPLVVRKTVEWFGNRREAAKAEAAAIRAESPAKNVALPDEDGLGGWTLSVPRARRRPVPSGGDRKFATTDDLWKRFNEAVNRSPDPEADMSKVLRAFVRHYVGEPGAKLPERPEPKDTGR